jgi:hypothetical protein
MGTWKHMAVLVQMVESKIDHLYGKGFEVYGAQWVDHDILSFVG